MTNRITDEYLVSGDPRPTRSAGTQPSPETGVGEQVKSWAGEVEKMIATHPGASLAAALGIGVVLGWWVKRI